MGLSVSTTVMVGLMASDSKSRNRYNRCLPSVCREAAEVASPSPRSPRKFASHRLSSASSFDSGSEPQLHIILFHLSIPNLLNVHTSATPYPARVPCIKARDFPSCCVIYRPCSHGNLLSIYRLHLEARSQAIDYFMQKYSMRTNE